MIDGSPTQFKLNGHIEFGKGRTENPEIGTTEDWWLINHSGGVEHPIHVHLINFQVMDYVPLRRIDSCDLYLAEFYMQALSNHSVVGQDNFTLLNDYFNLDEAQGGVRSTRYVEFCKFYGGAGIQSDNSKWASLVGTNFNSFTQEFAESSYEVNR